MAWLPSKFTRRLIQLYIGLVAYGISGSMLVFAQLGLDPWNVLHQGLPLAHIFIPIFTIK